MSEGAPHPGVAAKPAAAGNFGRLVRLTGKELNETLRDRRTLLTLVLMPLLLYPLLALGFRTLFSTRMGAGEAPAYRIGYRSDEDHLFVRPLLDEGEKQLAASGVLQEPERTTALGIPRANLVALKVDDVETSVTAGMVDVAFRPRTDRPGSAEWEMIYLPDSFQGYEAARYIRMLLEAGNVSSLETKVNDWAPFVVAVFQHRRELPPSLGTELAKLDQALNKQKRPLLLRPREIRLTVTALSPLGGRRTPPLLVLIPLVLTLMTITGAVYPAIDLTAGERERGTLEVLMAAPVPRMSLLLAKYGAVLVVAMLTGLMNMGAMMISIYLSGLDSRLLGEQGLSLLVLVEIFFLLLLLTSFFSALLLALSSLARSFKEAQAYLVPLMVVALIPGMFSLVPGIRLEGIAAFIPLLNIVLLARDVFAGTAELGDAVVVVGMTFVYALAAITLAAAVFGRDVLMAGPAGRGTPQQAEASAASPMVQ
jgi:ABC-2 type transport system permease protein/sodium transport system permease protein